jgi:hypothetical protein
LFSSLHQVVCCGFLLAVLSEQPIGLKKPKHWPMSWGFQKADLIFSCPMMKLHGKLEWYALRFLFQFCVCIIMIWLFNLFIYWFIYLWLKWLCRYSTNLEHTKNIISTEFISLSACLWFSYKIDPKTGSATSRML